MDRNCAGVISHCVILFPASCYPSFPNVQYGWKPLYTYSDNILVLHVFKCPGTHSGKGVAKQKLHIQNEHIRIELHVYVFLLRTYNETSLLFELRMKENICRLCFLKMRVWL